MICRDEMMVAIFFRASFLDFGTDAYFIGEGIACQAYFLAGDSCAEHVLEL